MQNVVGDHQRGDNHEECDEQVEHRRGARLLEVILTEERQIGRQTGEHDKDVEDLAEDGQTEHALLVLLSTLRLFDVRHQDVVGVLIDDMSSFDDLLSALYDAAG